MKNFVIRIIVSSLNARRFDSAALNDKVNLMEDKFSSTVSDSIPPAPSQEFGYEIQFEV